MSAPKGWYPDQSGKWEARQWDGSSWTHNVARGGSFLVDPTPVDDFLPPIALQWQESIPSAPLSSVSPPRIGAGGSQRPRPRRKKRQKWPYVVVLLVALVVIGFVTGTTDTQTQDRSTPSGEADSAEEMRPACGLVFTSAFNVMSIYSDAFRTWTFYERDLGRKNPTYPDVILMTQRLERNFAGLNSKLESENDELVDNQQYCNLGSAPRSCQEAMRYVIELSNAHARHSAFVAEFIETVYQTPSPGDALFARQATEDEAIGDAHDETFGPFIKAHNKCLRET